MTTTNAIRRFRGDNGLTQDDLGAKIGVTAATISRWEKGQREPRGELRRRLAEVMGVPISAIVEAVEPEPAQ